MNQPNKPFRTSRRFIISCMAIGVCGIFILTAATYQFPKTGAKESPVVQDVSSFNYFPADAYKVPHDLDSTSDQVELSRFAWQEFIALNWPSNYTSASPIRGTADQTKSVTDFLNGSANYPLVWQTYKHRVEIYPEDTSSYNTSFDSPPQYFYQVDGQSSIQKLGDPTAPPLHTLSTVFNNLDETSEIDLCTVFVDGDPNAPGASSHSNPHTASGLPGAPRRMIYEAKANRQMFDYVVQNHLYDTLTRGRRIAQTNAAVVNNGAGATYPCPDPNQICFPFGQTGAAEGSIEIKATWRQLTLDEYNSGRYLTAPVLYYRKAAVPGGASGDSAIYYDIVAAQPTTTSLPYGLVGLHIIHKTQNFPSYVFATFEQVDNLDTTQAYNSLFYYNRNSNPSVNPGKQYAYRYAKILAGTKQVNGEVQSQIRSLDPNSVWQYYKLIGVQGRPENSDLNNDYFLANIVTETNEVLRDFSGTLDNDNGTFDPTATNLYKRKIPYVQGGCKGCHANAQDADFSFITKNAPFDGTPDVINQPLLKQPLN